MVPEQRVFVLPDFHRTSSILCIISSCIRLSMIPALEIVVYGTNLRDQNLVARCDARSYPLPIPVQSAWPDCQNSGFVEVFDAALGQEDPGGGLCVCLDALYEYAVEERSERFDGLERGGLLKGRYG